VTQLGRKNWQKTYRAARLQPTSPTMKYRSSLLACGSGSLARHPRRPLADGEWVQPQVLCLVHFKYRIWILEAICSCHDQQDLDREGSVGSTDTFLLLERSAYEEVHHNNHCYTRIHISVRGFIWLRWTLIQLFPSLSGR
jgi:hypothetical protein